MVFVAFYGSSIAVGTPICTIKRGSVFSGLVVQEYCMKLLSRIAKIEMLNGLVTLE